MDAREAHAGGRAPGRARCGAANGRPTDRAVGRLARRARLGDGAHAAPFTGISRAGAISASTGRLWAGPSPELGGSIRSFQPDPAGHSCGRCGSARDQEPVRSTSWGALELPGRKARKVDMKFVQTGMVPVVCELNLEFELFLGDGPPTHDARRPHAGAAPCSVGLPTRQLSVSNRGTGQVTENGLWQHLASLSVPRLKGGKARCQGAKRPAASTSTPDGRHGEPSTVCDVSVRRSGSGSHRALSRSGGAIHTAGFLAGDRPLKASRWLAGGTRA